MTYKFEFVKNCFYVLSCDLDILLYLEKFVDKLRNISGISVSSIKNIVIDAMLFLNFIVVL